MTNFLGLGKTLFNSSASLIVAKDGVPEITLALSERLLRKKNTGAWPEAAIQSVVTGIGNIPCNIAENRDVIDPLHKERAMDSAFPFFDYLKSKQLDPYSRHLNPEVRFFTHHLCHAMAATLIAPFEKALVVVLDGAGSRCNDFPTDSEELLKNSPSTAVSPEHSVPHEECTVYLLDRHHEKPELKCAEKHWGTFWSDPQSGRHYSDGVGIFYETMAEFIFNCSRSAGKVMGLAPFGRVMDHSGALKNLAAGLPWEKSFDKKIDWQKSPHLPFYQDLAATTQHVFEQRLFPFFTRLRQKYPGYTRLIFTGGCALNCTFNGKLQREGLFEQIFIPPFPGDESIGLGAAAAMYLKEPSAHWSPSQNLVQQTYFGPSQSEPTEHAVVKSFGSGFQIERPASITEYCAEILKQGHVIAWFQGRSESGPRALGNRSLLARPDRPGLKDFLNSRIKFREAFRPYGASCAYDRAHLYFEAPAGFATPYMSFAVPTRPEYREVLREVTHVDGTCRYQSVHPSQNNIFFELLQTVGRQTGLYCLLNTSLNVMGEPIVESVADARHFLENMNRSNPSPIHGLAIGEFYIRARGHS